MATKKRKSRPEKSKPWPPQRHDRAYRRFFSLREMVEDLVRGFIPEDWVQHLDFANMEQMADVIIGEHWDRRDADTVWRIGWKGPHQGKAPLYVVLVFEFLSQPDHWAAVRMMAYVALVYQRLIDNGVVGPKDELPLVVPIVLYNGDPAWEAPEELEKLIVDLPGLERYRPRFRYLALDVKRYPLSELERMPNRAAALFQLEQSRGPEEILRGLERLREILSDRSDRLYGVYSQWLTEIFFASQAPPDVVERVRTLEDFSMLVDNILEWKKNVLLEGRKEGRKEGREEGRKEGEEVGIRKGELAVLIRQLTSKFGPLPAEVVDRLERADVDLLLAWSDRVLTARTLDEVLAD
jgi:hypothetical protein